jgi:hypothetical protein
MFLGVSGTVLLVNENDRKRLGKLIAEQRKTQYGTKSAAYKEASVNAATWDRAEAGETVREDRLQAVVRLLWPATGGDPERALAYATNQWANWEDRTTPMAFDETESDRITSWAAEHFERINHTLADMADTIEALSRKVGMTHGSQASTQKTEGPDDDDLGGVTPFRPRRPSGPPSAGELSEPNESVEPAADDVIPDDDEEPGGSR